MKAKIWNKHCWIEQTEPETLNKTFTEMLNDSGFHVLDVTEHFFEPFGYTCLYLLGESHLAIHTFPEENKTYVELSSCNKKMFDRFCALIIDKKGGEALSPQEEDR